MPWTFKAEEGCYTVNRADGERVATVHGTRLDAARIAAAPELLEALESIHKGLDPNVGGITITRNEILAISSAAIAKARGES